MKNLTYALILLVPAYLNASSPVIGEDFATVEVQDSKFMLYYRKWTKNAKYYKRVYSINGKLISSTQLKEKPWPNFTGYNVDRRRYAILKDKMFSINFSNQLISFPKKELKSFFLDERNKIVDKAKSLIDLNTVLPKQLKIRGVRDLHIDGDLLITIGWLDSDRIRDAFIFIFDWQKKEFINIYRLGEVDASLMGGCKVSRFLKYKDGYILIWKRLTFDNDYGIAPMYLTYLNLKKQKITKYLIHKKVSHPIHLSVGLTQDKLFLAYNQVQMPKDYSTIRTLVINLNKFLNQSSVAIRNPEIIEDIVKEATPPPRILGSYVGKKDGNFHLDFDVEFEGNKFINKTRFYSVQGKLIQEQESFLKKGSPIFRQNLKRRKTFRDGRLSYSIAKDGKSINVISDNAKSPKKNIALIEMVKDSIPLVWLSGIYKNKDLLFLTALLDNEEHASCILVFDLKAKKLAASFKMGKAVMKYGGGEVSRIFKYADNYLVIWKYRPKEAPEMKFPDSEKSNLLCSSLDIKKRALSRYIILKDVLPPLDMSVEIIDNTLLIVYSQYDKKGGSDIYTKFINIQELLKQKPALLTRPFEINK